MNTLEKVNAAEGLEDLYPIFEENRYTAGWHKKRRSLWKEPATDFAPRHWSYTEAYAALERASLWIDTELAERRNLLMFNPVGDNDYDTVRTLVTAYQMIKPGEHARAHRHTPNALRLILDAGPGLFTVVDGVKLPMVPGDVLLTPGGCWHSHYNEGKGTGFWIDFLDVPLVHRLEPMFYKDHPDTYQTVEQEPKAHPFWFKRTETDIALDAATAEAGGALRYILPTADVMKTMQLTCLRLPQNASTGRVRDTVSRIFAVVKGTGRFTAESQQFDWSRGDVFAAPAWAAHELTASADAELLEVSDFPVMEKLGFLISEN